MIGVGASQSREDDQRPLVAGGHQGSRFRRIVYLSEAIPKGLLGRVKKQRLAPGERKRGDKTEL